MSYLVARRSSNGSLDTAFGTNGKTALAPVTRNDYDFYNADIQGMKRLSTGDLIVHGWVPFTGSYLLKLSPGGKMSTTFGSYKGAAWFTAKEYRIDDIAVQKDDKIVVFGNDYDSTCYVYRANTDGSPDQSFDKIEDFEMFGTIPPQTYNASARGVAMQNDGKIVVMFSTSGDVGGGTGIARMNTDGSTDLSFARYGARTVDFASDHRSVSWPIHLLLDSSQRIVVLGESGPYPEDSVDSERMILARLSNTQTTAIKTIYGTSGDDFFHVATAEDGRMGLRILDKNWLQIGYVQSADYASLKFDLGSGNDTLIVEEWTQNDWARYKILPIRVLGGKGNDTITGGRENDTLAGGAGKDSPDAGPGDDTFIADDAGGDDFRGGGGKDILDFSATKPGSFSLASEWLYHNNVSNMLRAGSDYTLRCTAGNDSIGSIQRNNLFQNFTIDTGAGDDVVGLAMGSPGKLIMGEGSDSVQLDIDNWTSSVDLGPGDDLLQDAYGGGETTRFIGGSGYDRVVINLDTSELQEDHVYQVGSGVEDFVASSPFQKVVITGTNASESIMASGPNIIIKGLGGNDKLIALPEYYNYWENRTLVSQLFGGDGDDTLIAGTGNDTLSGGKGNDTADYSKRTENLKLSLDNIANYGATGELDNLSADIETILGGSGNDLMVGNPFANKLVGNAGNDTLWGGDGNDTLIGGPGTDSLFGQGGDDVIVQ